MRITGQGNYKSFGLSDSRFYSIYKNLNRRCNEKTNNRYYRYGGLGIKCNWKTFIEFKDDMYESYLEHVKNFGEKETQIDRLNNKKNYCKENCKWSNLIEQARNRKGTKLINIDGVSKSIREWSNIYNKPYKQVFSRIKYLHMNPLDALTIDKYKRCECGAINYTKELIN